MSTEILGKDPDPKRLRVRKFHDNRHIPYRNLVELRAAMREDDGRLISYLGSRMMEDYWLEPVTDPSMAARSKVSKLAEPLSPRLVVGFPKLVEAVYGVASRETSPLIDDIDQAIVTTIAARTNKAMVATVFKYDLDEGKAPTQQKDNIANAVRVAEDPLNTIDPAYGDLSAVVCSVYELLVPGTVQMQQYMFSHTSIDDWDAGLAGAFGRTAF